MAVMKATSGRLPGHWEMVYTVFFGPALCNIVGVVKGDIGSAHTQVEDAAGIVGFVVFEEGLGAVGYDSF